MVFENLAAIGRASNNQHLSRQQSAKTDLKLEEKVASTRQS
jgi:hypothetical protein